MVQTDTAQAHVITRRATDTAATTAQLIARRVSIAAAAAEPVRDRAQAARTSRTTPHIRARAQSIRTTAAGNATRDTTTKMASVSAAPTKAVGRTSSVQVRATTRVAMASNATTAQPIVKRASFVAAAVVPVRDRAGTAQTGLRMRPTRARAQST